MPTWARVVADQPRYPRWRADEPAPADELPADRFLRAAVLTFSDADSPTRRAAAADLLIDHPDLATTSLGAAAAIGDVDAVRALLAAGAPLTGGPFGWSALMYQAYARVPTPPEAAAVAIARMLLAAGAKADDGRQWDDAPTPFTVLTGLFDAGERDQPPHPHARALAQILLLAGADPADEQLLYNRMFGPADDHLELLFAHGIGRSARGERALRWLLHWAVTHDQRDRVRLLADHGVDIASPLDAPLTSATAGRTPIDVALLNGHVDLADLLASRGAGPATLSAADRFVADAMAGSTAGAREADPSVAAAARGQRPGLVVWATSLDRPESVALLVAAGFDVNALGRGDTTIEQEWETALHVAAGNGRQELVELLLSLGADTTVRDKRFDATPVDWARFFGHLDLARLFDR